MKTIKKMKLSIVCAQLLATVLFMFGQGSSVAQANGISIQNTPVNTQTSTTVGNGTQVSPTPVATPPTFGSLLPAIRQAVVTGDVNPQATGMDYFKNIAISLIGENLTDDHFLTPEGLHWSARTQVELIRGQAHGLINSEYSFGAQNNPTVPVTAYRMDNGDSGRITYVGRTKSGIDLDLVWTVVASDKADWEANSRYGTQSHIKGLGFTGEQFIPNAKGNSIVVLYNNAGNIALNYKIVKHGTMIEQPVIISFISTDIDAGQGVQTDLANIVEFIPDTSGLAKKDNIIYDKTPGLTGLNGTADVPKGSYLGAGFVSSFHYVFYAPSPERVTPTFMYPVGVRYDMFGSSLQTKILAQIVQQIRVNYVDDSGKTLKPSQQYDGMMDKKYTIDALKIENHQLVDMKKDMTNPQKPVVTFIYKKERKLTLHFVDDKGNTLLKSKTYTLLDGQKVAYRPEAIQGYKTPEMYQLTVSGDTTHTFRYIKEVIPVIASTITTPTLTNIPRVPVYTPAPLVSASNVPSQPAVSQNIGQSFTLQKRSDDVKAAISSAFGPKVSEKNIDENDPFYQNTKMNANQKKRFLEYIHAVAKEAREKYGDDINKINHAVANAIAYPSYSDNHLQKEVNDYGQPSTYLTESMWNLLKDLNRDKTFLIDFPHLAAPITTFYKSNDDKEAIKHTLGNGVSNILLTLIKPDPSLQKEVFLQLNSLTGDMLTYIDDKDRRSDLDALILLKHPRFRDLPLNERIEKYYHLENLNEQRERLYQDILHEQAVGDITPTEQDFLNTAGAFLSFGGILMLLYGLGTRIIDEGKKIFTNPKKYFGKIGERIVGESRKFISNPVNYSIEVLGKGIKKVGSVSNTIGVGIMAVSKTIFYHLYNFFTGGPKEKKLDTLSPDTIDYSKSKYIFKKSIHAQTTKTIGIFKLRKINKPKITELKKENGTTRDDGKRLLFNKVRDITSNNFKKSQHSNKDITKKISKLKTPVIPKRITNLKKSTQTSNLSGKHLHVPINTTNKGKLKQRTKYKLVNQESVKIDNNIYMEKF